MTDEEERELNAIGTELFGKQLVSLTDVEMDEARCIRELSITLSCPEVPEIDPRARDIFADLLEESGPSIT